MKIFDLHCDTAFELHRRKLTFENDVTHLNASTVAGHEVTQCFTVFFDDTEPSPRGIEYFRTVTKEIFPMFHRPNLTPVLTVEGAGLLAENEGWIDEIKGCGCRMAGIVWNGKNLLATGAATDDRALLTEQGREAVEELIRKKIAVDVSHLSNGGTEEILTLTDAPIAASHSNARTVYNHYRNLTDAAAKEIFRRGGVVGLNLYPRFLTDGEATQDHVLRHAEHFFSLGGEHGVALGCDLDGIECMPRGMKDFSSLTDLYERFVSAFGKQTADDVFYNNAQRFFTRFD